MSKRLITNRRQFLKTAAAAAGAASAPYFVPASALGLGATPPSDRIVVGCIGTGGKGRNNMEAFLSYDDVQVVAVCDVDANHRKAALDIVNRKYESEDCKAYNDFQELVAREDIDAVSIATPDHWHALTSIAAANAGKDVYCEKPLANSVGEGRAICDAVQKGKRILQTGSHERSNSQGRYACELVRSGRIGKLQTIRIQMPCEEPHHQKVMAYSGVPAPQKVPDHFDYDFWLGHTAKAPYSPDRCHFWWRFILAYGGGEMTDRGAHIIDLAQLGGGFDDTGPVEIVAQGTRSETSLYDAFMDYKFENTYANGVRMIGENKGPRGVKFEGDDGWVFIHVHGCKLEASSPELLDESKGENKVQLGRGPDHRRNFIDCVKSRKDPMATAEIGHRTATICHLNNIAMLLGRALKWDPSTEKVVGDDEANALLTPKMRDPWTLERFRKA